MTAKLKMACGQEQKQQLRETRTAFNLAANHAAQTAYDFKTFGRSGLHALVYQDLRTELPSQMVIRAIGKAVDVYKNKHRRSKLVKFKPTGSVVYDQRNFWVKDGFVSISTLSGRLVVPFKCGQKHAELLSKFGQATLIEQRGNFFLLVSVEIREESEQVPTGFLGIDLGVKNLATDSTGRMYGSDAEEKRAKIQHRRSTLQKVGTKNSRRRLKKNSKKEANYTRTLNHTIAKRLVSKAKARGCAIVLEDLKGIRKAGRRFRTAERARIHSWSFYQLRQFIEYKACLAGVPVITVNPAQTSQTCSSCDHCEKSNRRGDKFKCKACGFREHADKNAALNLEKLGHINWPMAEKGQALTASLPL